MSHVLHAADHERFLAAVEKFRKHDLPLEPQTSLLAVGIDSLDSISLLIEIEAALGLQIPDEALSPDAFETVGKLWEVVLKCRMSQT